MRKPDARLRLSLRAAVIRSAHAHAAALTPAAPLPFRAPGARRAA